MKTPIVEERRLRPTVLDKQANKNKDLYDLNDGHRLKLEETGVKIRKLILKNISIGKRGSLANILEKSLESMKY